ILALAVSTSTVRAWHRERGLSTEQSWHVLADLGQQMRVHRRSSGRLGLHQLPWMALNWRGRLVALGRLQFDLHRAERGTGQERWASGSAHLSVCASFLMNDLLPLEFGEDSSLRPFAPRC